MTEITMAGNFDHERATEEELEEAVEGLQQLIDAAFEPLVAFLERQKKTVPIGHGSEVPQRFNVGLKQIKALRLGQSALLAVRLSRKPAAAPVM